MTAKVEISKRLVLMNAASSAVLYLLDISVLVWLQQYLLHRISPDEYSLYPVVMSVMVFVPLLTTVLTSGLGRYILEAYAKGDDQRVTQIVSTMTPILTTASLLLLIIGWALAWYIDRVLTIAPEYLWDGRLMMGLLMTSFVIQLPLSPLGVGLYVKQRFVLQNCLQLLKNFIRIGTLFVLLFGVSTRVLWVVVASVFAEFCILPMSLTISRRLIPALKIQVSNVQWRLLLPLLTFGTWNFVGGLADAIVKASNPLILNKLATSLDVSCFYLGSLAVRQFERTISFITSPMQPVVTALYVVGNHERLNNIYLQVGRYTLWVSFFVILPLVIFSREIIKLYAGSEYLDAAFVIIFLLTTVPVWFGHIMLSLVVYAKADLGPYVRRTIVMQSFNILLTIYFVGWCKFGAIGSALGSLVTDVIGVPVLMYPLAFRTTGIKIKRWLSETAVPGAIPGFFSGILLLALRAVKCPSTWAELGTYTILGCVCNVLLIYFVGLQEKDRSDLQELTQRLKTAIGRVSLFGI